MRIEIDYCSRTGYTEQIAYALREIFAGHYCQMVDIDLEEPTLDADIYLVGFGVRKNACPFSTLEWLEQLSGKTILLFCTSALGSISGYQQRLEAQIMPFLPDDCDYKGMLLCPAKMSKEEFSYLETLMIQNGKQENVLKLQSMYEESLSHPNTEDLKNAQEFVIRKFK